MVVLSNVSITICYNSLIFKACFHFLLFVVVILGLLSDRSKVKILKGRRKKEENGIKCVQCMAISTDEKFLVSYYNQQRTTTFLSQSLKIRDDTFFATGGR